MPGDHFLNAVSDVDAPDVESAVLSHETAYTTHVVAVVAVLVPPEAVDIRVEDIKDRREAVQVLALVALRTQTPGEEEAEITARRLVRRCPTRVVADVTPRGCGRLGQVCVLAIAA